MALWCRWRTPLTHCSYTSHRHQLCLFKVTQVQASELTDLPQNRKALECVLRSTVLTHGQPTTSRTHTYILPIFAVVCICIYFLVFVLLPCWQMKMNITLNISLMLQTVECYDNSLKCILFVCFLLSLLIIVYFLNFLFLSSMLQFSGE